MGYHDPLRPLQEALFLWSVRWFCGTRTAAPKTPARPFG